MKRGIKSLGLKVTTTYVAMALGFTLFILVIGMLEYGAVVVSLSDLTVYTFIPVAILLVLFGLAEKGELVALEDEENLIFTYNSHSIFGNSDFQELVIPKGSKFNLEFNAAGKLTRGLVLDRDADIRRGYKYTNELVLDNGTDSISIGINMWNFVFKKEVIELIKSYAIEVKTDDLGSSCTWECISKTDITLESIDLYDKRNKQARQLQIAIVAIAIVCAGGYIWGKIHEQRQMSEFEQKLHSVSAYLSESGNGDITDLLGK